MSRLLTAIFLLALTCAAPLPALAHSPDVATFELEELADGWVLAMHVPQAAVDASMVARYPDEDWQALGREGYELRVFGYLRDAVHLQTPAGGTVELGQGGIRVGGHQTDLFFAITTPLTEVASLDVRVDAFAEDGTQSNVFRVRSGEFTATRVLHEDNGFHDAIPLRAAPPVEGAVATTARGAAALAVALSPGDIWPTAIPAIAVVLALLATMLLCVRPALRAQRSP